MVSETTKLTMHVTANKLIWLVFRIRNLELRLDTDSVIGFFEVVLSSEENVQILICCYSYIHSKIRCICWPSEAA